MWALIHGLRPAREKALRLVRVEVNSMAILEWITEGSSKGRKHTSLIQECREMMRKPWRVELKLVYKEGNQAADFMAKLSVESNGYNLKHWFHPSRGIKPC